MAILAQTTQEIAPAPSISALMDKYIGYMDKSPATTRAYIIDLRQFAAYLQFREIRQPERSDIIAYRDYLLQLHDQIRLDNSGTWEYVTDGAGNHRRIACSAATVRHYLQAVKLFFAWTKAESLYPDIAENIRTPRIDSDAPPKRDALTAAEAMDILSYIDGIEATTATEREQKARIKALYLLAITAGTRTIELSRANVRDVVTRGKNATIYLYGKGHDEPDRPIAIPTETADAVREYIDIRADKPTSDSALFVATGNRSGGQRLAATTISRLLKDLLRRAGYNSERLTAHSLRHTAATAALEATGDIYAVQKFCRHSSPATTEKYLHTAENTRETSDRLMAYYHSATDNSNATNIN